MKADTTFFVPVDKVAVDCEAVVVEIEAATLSTDETCGLFCTTDIDDEEVGDEFVTTLSDDDENEPLFSFSLDVVSLEDEMILLCRFLVILAYCEEQLEGEICFHLLISEVF